MTKKEVRFLIEHVDKGIVSLHGYFSPDKINEIPIQLMKKILTVEDYQQSHYLEVIANYYTRIDLELIDFCNKTLKFKFLVIFSSDRTNIVGVSGLFRNLRELILKGKRDFVESIIMLYYDKFIEELKTGFESAHLPTVKNLAELFRVLYTFYVTEKMSDGLKLFLEMK